MLTFVSIIIPTYNREHLIGETLDSILAQTYTNWECIIVDDGSTDKTSTLIKSYITIDNRFQYHERPFDRIKGANACRNYGFEQSKGNYVKWFDSDDIMHPKFLEKQVVILEENKDLDFCASFSKQFSGSIKNDLVDFYPEIFENKRAVYNFIIGKLYFLTPSSLWRRQTLIEKELFDEKLCNAHESDFNFRRLIEGNKFLYLHDFLFYVRRGHQSIDKESINNHLSIQSQFDYFQKIYKFLNADSRILTNSEINQLKKYVIYRQLIFFYQTRLLLNFKKSKNNFKSIFKNLLSVKLHIFDFNRIFFGLILILFFKKGFVLLHINKFDIRNK